MTWSELLEESAAWHGVTTPAQARAHGVPTSTWNERVRREAWPQPLRGAAPRLLPGTTVTPTSRAAAALAHLGYPAALTRWSALRLLGAHRLDPPRVQVLLPAKRAVPTVAAIEVVRSRRIHPTDLHDVEQLCCATPGRVLTDLAAVTPYPRLRSVAIDLRFRDETLLAQLAQVHRARGPYPGARNVAAVLAELTGDGSDSGFEFTARDRFTEIGLPPDTQQAEVHTPRRTYHLDLAWTRLEVGIECLGWAYHRDPDDQERDALRRNAITTVDRYAIFHLTWKMLAEPLWSRFVGQVAGVLEARSRERGVSPR